MTTRSRTTTRYLVASAALVSACADATSSAQSGEDDAGPPKDAAPAEDDAAHDAGSTPPTCSLSHLCVSDAPIDRRINLTSVWGSSERDVWAVGTSGTVLHHDGARWEKSADTSSTYTLRSVWLGRSDDVWILDGNRIRHAAGWNGPTTEWSFFGDGSLEEHVPSALRGGPDCVWLARQTNPRAFGSTLTKLGPWHTGGPSSSEDVGPKRGQTLTAIAVAGPEEIWAVGESKVVHVTASGLEEHDSRARTLLRGVWADASGVWLVGEGGTLRHARAGGSPTKGFEVVASPVSADLYGVFGFGSNDVWAVGEASTVLHWDGTRWAILSTPFDDVATKPRLLAVWGSSPSDVWIAGAGTMLRYQGDAP